MSRSLLKGNSIAALFMVMLLLAGTNTIVAQTKLPATQPIGTKHQKKTVKHFRSKHRKHRTITHQSANDKELQQLKEEKNKQKGLK